MCGIAGFIETRPPGPSRDRIERMTELLRHRGPDDAGVAIIGPAALGHRRLSIIDLSAAGHQPMTDDIGDLYIVFNGEIYNFAEVRRELESHGERFRSRSDTEVILKSYRRWGPSFLTRLNGMFAFAIWDSRRRSLFAARDRLGEKPFFYRRTAGGLAFASELKALLADPEMDRRIDVAALDEFLTFGYIAAPRSILQGVSKLLPGEYVTYENDRIETRRYWELPVASTHATESMECSLEQLDKLFRDAVRLRLVSDVPVGAFLSGGLDSSAVVAMMAQVATGTVNTYTIGFEERGFSEIEDARVVARHFGTNHHEYSVRADAVSILPDLVWHLDEPFGDSSAVPSYYVAKMAAQDVKVVLSGDGGDELFAGYTRYRDALKPRPWRWIPRSVRRRWIGSFATRLPLEWPGRNRLYEMGHMPEDSSPEQIGIYPYIKERIYSPSLHDALASAKGESAVGLAEIGAPRTMDRLSRLQYVDTRRYLPDDILVKVDRMTMAHGLESRAPLLDHVLVDYVASLPPEWKLRNGVTKYLFRRMAARYLPPSVLDKKKQGFGIPKAKWFRSDLRAQARERLLDRRALDRGYFDRRVLERVLDAHNAGRRDYSDWIWCLLVLEEWHRTFLDPDTRRL